ncbi:RIIa domain-containing protein 1 [Geodia barretti]|uniref:RIIa domain-containing protein 1 n=1 Tax=Geodia barretti TaxID=519541 RepID=A0AA35W2R2_GEOBA|nr:RIIa domain-containing protein 1 [Geodia barretti]
MRCSTEEQERHQSVAMEAELLAVETRLSGRPAQEINDTTALTGEQQSTLDKHKVTLRIENELFLRRHPELHTLLSSFVSEVLLKKPQNIKEFAAGYFSDPSMLRQRHSPEADNSQNTES